MSKKVKQHLTEAVNYKRSVISDGSTVYSLSSYDDVSLGRRRFAVYTPEGKRVSEDKEKELLAGKVENPLFAPREDV